MNDRWNWKNFPLPEYHLAFLVIGLIIHRFKPTIFLRNRSLGKILFFPLVIVGLLIIGWAVRESREMEIQSPTKVITSGPYAYSRNPMYLAWTLVFLSIALLQNTLWLALFLPAVIAVTHYFVILKEEDYLEKEFGQEYSHYRKRVHRYL